MTWIYDFPTWLFSSAVVLLFCSVSVAGLLLTRRWIGRSEEITHNDVAGAIITTVGTILAVVVSFMLVTVWEEFDTSAANVQREANAVSSLYSVAGGFDEPARAQIRVTLSDYVKNVVYAEWPAMLRGRYSEQAQSDANRVLETIVAYRASSPSQQNIQSDALAQAHSFKDARSQRLFDNRQGAPIALWVVLILIAMLTLGSAYFFRVQSLLAHCAMIAFLATVIALMFAMIAELDYPFRGDIHIPPTAWAKTLDLRGSP